MKNYRLWGKAPYQVVVVHGGPGAPGSIAPVARELATGMGVIEPLQTADSIEGQIKELAAVIKEQAETPITLVGWSWGASLSYMTAARYPELVKKLVLIGTSPILARKGPRPDQAPAYIERLSDAEKADFFNLVNKLWDEKTKDKNTEFRKLCRVIARAEIFKPIPAGDDVIEYQFNINQAIVRELNKLIEGGTLVETGQKIKCPVATIQGDYDTNGTDEVREALSRVIKDFRFIVVEKCGHSPWLEKYARDKFFSVLREEIIL
jgi:pimeloyl-ACP methyl ester carboxylesterase